MLPLCIRVESWIIDECLSSVLSLGNQSLPGCPISASPHFNKSCRASWKQVLHCRLSPGTNSTRNQARPSPASSPFPCAGSNSKAWQNFLEFKNSNLMCDDVASSGFAVRSGSFGMTWKLLQESSLVPYPQTCSFPLFSLPFHPTLSLPLHPPHQHISRSLWSLALVKAPCAQSSLRALYCLSRCLWVLRTQMLSSGFFSFLNPVPLTCLYPSWQKDTNHFNWQETWVHHPSSSL